jgi:uncharacterized protein YbaR (Trm112 family)
MHTKYPGHFCPGILEMKSCPLNRHPFRVVERAKFENPKPKPETLISHLEIEIKCPRCNEIVELYSGFDRLYYYCMSCSLYLRVG